MTKEKWPDWISGSENSEYLEKIKFEYIVSAELKRDDPYYERVASLWDISLDLDIDGQKSHVFLDYAHPLAEKFKNYLSNSKDFIITEDERPMQYGRYVYERKADVKGKNNGSNEKHLVSRSQLTK